MALDWLFEKDYS